MDKDQLQKKLLITFKIEADEHVRTIVDGLLQMEKNPPLQTFLQIAELLHREAHSLKGAARAVGLIGIELICQSIEKIFSAWKKQTLMSNESQFDVLHQAFTLLETAILNIHSTDIQIEKEKVTEIITNLNKLLSNEKIAPSASDPPVKKAIYKPLPNTEHVPFIQTVKVESKKLDSLLLKTEEMLTIKLAMKKYANEFNRLNEMIKSVRSHGNKFKENIFVEGINKIKTLENTLAHLHTQFMSNSYQFNSIIDSLLDDAKHIVMLPFSNLLDSFPMMIRNLAAEQGKHINFIMKGTEIEIDKRILDELKDAFVHLLRNSIDHGIEKPEERKNKPKEGTIKIEVSQFNDNQIEITISDDGGGIDLNIVKQSAIKQGYVTEEDVGGMSDQEILALIYLSGVSTSPILTNISGHGIGMSIVHEKIEKIGGSIRISSKPNEGTVTKITFPLSLTIFKGILIKSAGQSFMLPIAHVERIVRIPCEDIKTIENKETIQINSTILSLVPLHDILGLASQTDRKNSHFIIAAIIRIDGVQVAFQIDSVDSGQEALVKKLNKPLLRVKHISAMTILESGEVVPILNTNDLIKTIIKNLLPNQKKLLSVENEIINHQTILIVEDSITTRMLLKNILEMVGFTVLTAVDGIDALRLLKENHIDLVVSDIEMPRMDGFELTKNIRHDKKLSDLPVILVTTRDSKEDKEKGIEAGANAYIIKSNFDDNNLIKIIKRLI